MNTRKIWLWSLFLGLTVTVVAYFVVLPQEQATTVNIEASQMEEEIEVEEEPNFKREIANPIADLAEGKRAISIDVETASGVSGYIEPEAFVDVIAYETTEDKKKDEKFKSAVIVLENIKVLAAGKSADRPEEALHYQTVTLEVTPEDGVALSLAALDSDGFYLMLRNEGETETGKQGYKVTRKMIKEG
ncbi:Flp pilus assembly protein CpaB [Bacillus sp. B15-48]|uniref:Flp pilus assembly protein CpaB n=1 Tax=Bacillus sp. B15-48 TaxID=1548601 RepID=UPI00193FE111|nr:Flp pilus assembly protein CpaB [Bacillus sp. B15-48]MBM4764491.1 Flp pilus assembly protein CpaB [Bacillus sp. B15-48]